VRRTQAACVRNADAISSGVSSGEAISSKQKRPTGSRHDSESAPPAALRRHRRDHRAGGAGPSGVHAAREADSGRAERSRRAPSPDEVSGGAGGAGGAGGDAAADELHFDDDAAASGGAGGAGPADEDGAGGGAGLQQRRARGDGNASDMGVVFSPAAAVTGAESDGDEEVRTRLVEVLFPIRRLRTRFIVANMLPLRTVFPSLAHRMRLSSA
jgi:hypothetical protein